jgi:DNA-binding NtrC family response regulator
MSERQSRVLTTKVLLLVEDEVLVRLKLAQYLRECDYKVVEAASFDEALVILEGSGIAFDVVMSGLSLESRGFELSHWVHENRPNSPLILNASVQSAAKAAGDLCDEGPTMQKPYDPRLLAEEIDHWLRSTDRQRKARWSNGERLAG